jgi:hypothetical protein
MSKPQGLVRSEGLGKFKNFTSSGIEPATFQVVADCIKYTEHAQSGKVIVILNNSVIYEPS